MYVVKNPCYVERKEITRLFEDILPESCIEDELQIKKLFFRGLVPKYERYVAPSSDFLIGSHERVRRMRGIGESISHLLQPSEIGELEIEMSKAYKEIEEIVKEKWRYLVMQFGGIFLTEIRPNKLFIGNKSLSDVLIRYDGKKFKLDMDLLENYLRENLEGPVQIHFSDIMFNPVIQDYDLFSVTSGDLKKANIFLDLSRFLDFYNQGKETIVPLHLPYFEKWKNEKEVIEFGSLTEDGKRRAIFKADKVLKYLIKNWKTPSIKLALETGNGETKRGNSVMYALIYEPHHLKFLTQGRENLVNICEDVGHLNLTDVDWKKYLPELISEFHVSGNNGLEDQHTVATPKTLKNYQEIMSFLKFYSGNICVEIGRGGLSMEEFLTGIRNLAYTIFSEPSQRDFGNLTNIEEYLRVNGNKKILSENLNSKRYKEYETKKGSS